MSRLRAGRAHRRFPELVVVVGLVTGCYASDAIGIPLRPFDASIPIDADAARVDASSAYDASSDAGDSASDSGTRDAGRAKFGCAIWSGTLRCGAGDLEPSTTAFLSVDLRDCGSSVIGITDAPTDSNGDAYFSPIPVANLLDYAGQGPLPAPCAGRRPIVLTYAPGIPIVTTSVVFP